MDAVVSSPAPMPPPRRLHRMRRHGCELPWAPAQIVALVIVLLSIAVFYVFTVHELPSDLRCIVLVLVSVQVAMVTLLYIAISLLDPAHPAVIERQKQEHQPQTNPEAQSPEEDAINLEQTTGGDTSTSQADSTAVSPSSSSSSASSKAAVRSPLRCALCDASVSTGTRHCSVCRKCVVGFDHHCVYINTCIGSRNYPLFIALLTCSILLVATQFVIACFAIDRLRRRGETTRALIVGGLSLLPLLQLICMIILASFHTYLFCKGLRTYEWLNRFNQTQRYTAKTPTWRHQRHRRTVRYNVDYDNDDINPSQRSRVLRDEQAAEKIEVVAHV